PFSIEVDRQKKYMIPGSTIRGHLSQNAEILSLAYPRIENTQLIFSSTGKVDEINSFTDLYFGLKKQKNGDKVDLYSFNKLTWELESDSPLKNKPRLQLVDDHLSVELLQEIYNFHNRAFTTSEREKLYFNSNNTTLNLFIINDWIKDYE